eukprot:14612177-Alexandrium_andersonii.AAC.1
MELLGQAPAPAEEALDVSQRLLDLPLGSTLELLESERNLPRRFLEVPACDRGRAVDVDGQPEPPG